MEISVIVPTHNRSDALEMTLSNLAVQDFEESWEVVVINNNCSDDTDQVVGRWQERFPVPLRLVHETKPGASAARNSGVRASSGRYLVFIDNDILVPPDFLSNHYDSISRNPTCWITGPTVNLPEQNETKFGRYRRTLFPPPALESGIQETEGFGAANVSIPREDFESLGGFDENFFVASGEDRELAIRAQKRGIRILLDPRLIALHNDWAGSTLRDFCRRQSVYAQSDYYFLQKSRESFPRHELAKKNGRPSLRDDGPKLYAAKQVKRIVGSNVGQGTLIGLAEISERLTDSPALLWRLYRLTISGAIFRGFQEGIRIHSMSNTSTTENAE